MVTKDDVVEALHGVEDPELGMDIVELGLYYDAEIEGEHVKVIHSLTSMGCPAGPMIQESIHDAVAALPGVEQVEVELTFDPPWTPDRMSDDAKFILGFGWSALVPTILRGPAGVSSIGVSPGLRERDRLTSDATGSHPDAWLPARP